MGSIEVYSNFVSMQHSEKWFVTSIKAIKPNHCTVACIADDSYTLTVLQIPCVITVWCSGLSNKFSSTLLATSHNTIECIVTSAGDTNCGIFAVAETGCLLPAGWCWPSDQRQTMMPNWRYHKSEVTELWYENKDLHRTMKISVWENHVQNMRPQPLPCR